MRNTWCFLQLSFTHKLLNWILQVPDSFQIVTQEKQVVPTARCALPAATRSQDEMPLGTREETGPWLLTAPRCQLGFPQWRQCERTLCCRLVGRFLRCVPENIPARDSTSTTVVLRPCSRPLPSVGQGVPVCVYVFSTLESTRLQLGRLSWAC